MLLRIPLELIFLCVQDYHLLWSDFPKWFHFKYFLHIKVLQPHICLNKYGLGCSRFDRLYSGNHYCFLFLRLLRCFSSPGLLPINWIILLHSIGLPHSEIFGYNSYLALPRSLSQLVTSFIASESQGIRHTLLVTFLSPY